MNSKPGPLIGILTAMKANGFFTGNKKFYEEIQKKLISHNGISFIFTLDDVQKSAITGYRFSFEKKRWVKSIFPFPDLVYNRIPFRKLERKKKFETVKKMMKEKNIPFFNPCFIDKKELFLLFGKHPVLKSFIPTTKLHLKEEELQSFLKKHESIYLKPANSSRGKGVYRLSQLANGKCRFEGIKLISEFHSFGEFWQTWSETIIKNNYLAQEAIDAATYEGHRFDFRILAHAENNKYRLTGVGIRQSQSQDITTHIPSGGKLIPYKLLQTDSHDQFFQTIIPLIGKALTEQFGFFGEFSIDAGVSKTGKYYIYEVNSKPMSFDEPEIEEEKVNSLCRLFLELAAPSF